jgi:hypothetical protein
MSSAAVRTQSSFSPRGLATVALLKANFDAGKDHIEMFQPFVLDCIAQIPREDFSVDDLKDAMRARHSLAIPADTLRVLLGRLVRKKVVRREAGRYVRTSIADAQADLASARASVESHQRVLAEALLEFGASRGLRLGSVEDALALILQFLSRYHVSLALSDSIESSRFEAAEEDPGDSRHSMVVVAGFLRDVVRRNDSLTVTLQEMLEGFVLQNAMFLKDISSAARRFQHLDVFLDSGLVLAAVGLTGEAAEVAMKEGLSLLKDTGAHLGVFDVTLKEVRRILTVYEDHLATSQGRESLHPTVVTRHVLTKKYTPSDVREIGALLETRLLDIGVQVRELPKRKSQYTLGEEALTRKLATRDAVRPNSHRKNGSDPRAQHDVDCIAGVLTIRAGRTALSFDHSRAVFATASWMTLKNAVEWFEEQELKDVPPIIHHLALSNIAWLKKPAHAVKLQLHELVALCSAVLVPSRKIWDGFLGHLRRMRDRGEVSSDEVTAIVASSLTDNLLIEQDRDDDDFDAESFTEIAERIKATYQEKSSKEVAAAEQKARELELDSLRVRSAARKRATSISKAICNVIIALVVPVLIIGTVLAVPGVRAQPGPRDWIPGSLLGLIGLMGILWGFDLRGSRTWLHERLSRRIEVWMIGE